MKNIVFVTNFLGNGGAARVMSILANKLISENNAVTIVSFLEKSDTYYINPNIKFIELKEKKSKIKKIIELRKILKSQKNPIIISFEYFVNMTVIISNLFLKNKLIISERNDPSKEGNKHKKLRNFLYLFSDILVCQTEDAKKYFPMKIQNKSVIIPNPVKDDLPSRWKGKRNKNIINFCRIEKQKNIDLLIDAFNLLNKEYKDYKLIIYGNGTEKNRLVSYASANKNIIFKDFEDNLHSKIVDSSMFVSTSDYEGISNSMIEAMAIGLPTICTDCPCGGANMMIKDGVNGLLVPVGDVLGVYNAMKKIIDDKNLSTSLSKEAEKIKNVISSDIIIKKWYDVIEVENFYEDNKNI